MAKAKSFMLGTMVGVMLSGMAWVSNETYKESAAALANQAKHQGKCWYCAVKPLTEIATE